MRVWDSIASQTKPVRVYETPFIADVRLMAEAAQKTFNRWADRQPTGLTGATFVAPWSDGPCL